MNKKILRKVSKAEDIPSNGGKTIMLNRSDDRKKEICNNAVVTNTYKNMGVIKYENTYLKANASRNRPNNSKEKTGTIETSRVFK